MKYLTLIGEMAKQNVNWNSITNKIGGESDFSVAEAIKIRDRYFPEWKIENLFRRE